MPASIETSSHSAAAMKSEKTASPATLMRPIDSPSMTSPAMTDSPRHTKRTRELEESR